MQQLGTKLLYLLFMLFLISVISFLAIHAAPNSFFAAGELNPNMTEEAVAQLKAVYGLDKPLFQQYFDWLVNLPDEFPQRSRPEVEKTIRRLFKTDTGRNLAESIYLKER